METKHGFIIAPVFNLEVLYEQGERDRYTHLWVMPESRIEGDLRFSQHDGNVWSLRLNWNDADGVKKLKSATGWRVREHGGSHQVTVVFLENTDWYGTELAPGPFYGLSAQELRETIAALEEELGVAIAGSPMNVGWNLLKLLEPDTIARYPKCDLRGMHFTVAASDDILWARNIETDELFLHKFDRRSAFPAAAVNNDTWFGVDTPEHVNNGAGIDKKAVGVWRCCVWRDCVDSRMPVPSRFRQPSPDDHWLSRPTINMLRSMGFTVDVYEGYQFPNRARIFTRWGNLLWAARAKFEDMGMIAAANAIKKIMVATIGQTSASRLDGQEDTDALEKKRPDFKMQIRARNAEIVWFNCLKIKQMYGAYPVIVYNDAVYYLSNEEDGRAAFPCLTEREGKLGGYRYEGHVGMHSALATALNEKATAARKLELLNKIGWTK